MRCAILTRVSTEEQTRPNYNSLQTQEEICRAYVNVQRENGWTVARVYEDAGNSGKDLKRPAIQSLMADVASGLIDVVVAYKLDRVSRSLQDFYKFWSVLQVNGASFVSATQAFDTTTPAGMLMLNVLLSFGQYERELTVERTATKMRARAEKGLWNGGFVPLGYAYDKDTQLLSPDPMESRIIHDAYDAVMGCRSLHAAAEQLNSLGHRSKIHTIVRRDGSTSSTGGNPFSLQSLAKIIRNPIYRGVIQCQGTSYQGRHEAIVSAEVWDSANRLLDAGGDRRRPPIRTADRHVHLLKGILRCANCGSAMTPYPSGKLAADGSRYLYYSCVSVVRYRGASPCKARSISARAFEDGVIAMVAKLAEDSDQLSACLEIGRRTDQTAVGRLEERRERLGVKLDATSRRLGKLIALFEDGDAVPDAVKERCVVLDRERSKLRLEIEQVQLEIGDHLVTTTDPARVAARLRQLSARLQQADLVEKRRLLKDAITSISVKPYVAVSECDSSSRRAASGDHRTRGFSLNIQLKQNPPESLDSAGLVEIEPHRVKWSSGKDDFGSPPMPRRRVRFGLHLPLRLDEGWVLGQAEEADAEISELPALPPETPAERALRFHGMLEQAGSQAALARRLGCSRAWISKALRHLPRRETA